MIQTVYLQNDRDIYYLLSQKGSWVHELARKQASQKDSESVKRQLQAAEKRIAQMKRTIRNLENSSVPDKVKAKNRSRAKKLRDQIAKMNKKIQPLRDTLAQANQDFESVDLDEFVEEAYLRTLSRFPTAEESERCVSFIKEDEGLAKGLTGVLWALVNTKEFIVNH